MKNVLVFLFLILASVLVFSLILKGSWGVPTSNDLKYNTTYSLRDGSNYLLTKNLIENHTFILNNEQFNLAAPDVGYYKGKTFNLHPPGLSILAIPFYIVGTLYNLSLVATFAMTMLFAIANQIFIFLIGRQIMKLPYWVSILASLIFGFASISLVYAFSLYQHQLSTFFIISSFYAVYQYKIRQKWGFLWGILVWINYGLAIIVDYPNAILMLPVMIYFLIVSLSINKVKIQKLRFSLSPLELYFRNLKIKLRPAIILTSIFFIVITLIHGYYNYVNFGGWTKISGSLPLYNKEVLVNKNVSNNQKVNPLDAAKKLLAAFKPKYLLSGSYLLLFSPDKGIFFFNPIFILSVIGIFYALKETELKKIELEKATLLSIPILTFLLYASFYDPWGGTAFGPRYLIPAMPFLALYIAYFLVITPYQRISKVVAFLFINLSVGISLLGAITTNVVPPIIWATVLESRFGIPRMVTFALSPIAALIGNLTSTAVQTKLEMVGLHSRFGILSAFDFLKKGKTDSFAFNNFFQSYINLIQYYWIIFTIIMIIFFFVLFVLPSFPSNAKIGTKKI